MKRILLLAGIGALALAAPGWVNEAGAKSKGRGAGVSHAASARVSHSVGSAHLNSSRRISSGRQRSYRVTSHLSNNTVVHRNNVPSARLHASSQHRGQIIAASRARRSAGLTSQRNVSVNRAKNVTVNRGNNLAVNRQRNARINNNWRGQRFNGQNYAAFRNYHREWHNRNWWRHNHSRIIFVSGGWYYWDTGYWYPAWGYDPYAYYPYDGPIYGYNDLSPDQVIENVQMQLQRDGYYAGPIDGVLGPMTRQALAAFQADRGLAVTSAVDEPTLATLGLT